MEKEIKILTDKISTAKSIVIFAHKNPDGDAMCSVLALARLILLNFNKTPLCIYDGNVPKALDNFPDRDKFKYYEHIDLSQPFDLAIVLDYGTVKHIEWAAAILENAKYTVEIDHHKNDNKIAKLCIDDENASSVGEILYRIMVYEKWESDIEIKNLLATSILTDTGFFKYALSSEPLRIMADLVDNGVSIKKIAIALNNKPRKTVLTEAEVASKAEFFFKKTLAVAVINKKDYKNLDGRGEIVLNLLGQIGGVDYIVLLKQQKENQIGLSIRSKRHPINKIAETFGGGGHDYAAGAVVNDSLENVYAKVLELFKEI